MPGLPRTVPSQYYSRRVSDESKLDWSHSLKLAVVMHPAEEGGFWAEIPALPGCVSEGETLAETLVNIREAAEGWLEVADN